MMMSYYYCYFLHDDASQTLSSVKRMAEQFSDSILPSFVNKDRWLQYDVGSVTLCIVLLVVVVPQMMILIERMFFWE